MKHVKYFIAIASLTCLVAGVSAQNINWKTFDASQKHIINLNAGWDYATSFGVGYGYKLNAKLPIVLNAEYSMPAGKNVFDDFKSKVGAQARVLSRGNFAATVKVLGIFRQYSSDLTTMSNFGCEFAAVAGYYKNGWYLAGEVGFDKAIVSHIRQTPDMRENYPAARTGWYIPLGGNIYYGLQTGLSVKHNDVSLKIGKVIEQDFKTPPLLPFYLQLGFNHRF